MHDILISQIDTIPILKDVTFWHLLATTACGLFLKMLNKHLDKTEKTLENVTQILNSVITKNEIQELRIKTVEKRVDKLENG
jgi:uncharacterized protein Yka (UPF0111/DUF47 family)